MKAKRTIGLSAALGMCVLLLPLSASAFYNPTAGKWLSRDPINELGFNLLTRANTGFNRIEECNPYAFVHGDPIDRYDVNGLIGPAIPVTIGLAAILVACTAPDFNIAHSRYADSGDGFKHCWVSCRISKKCGAAIAQLAGLTKEARDEVMKDIEEKLQKDIDGDGVIGGIGFDTRDLLDNQACIGWESYLGPVGQIAGALCRESCEQCCRRKVGYGKTNE